MSFGTQMQAHNTHARTHVQPPPTHTHGTKTISISELAMDGITIPDGEGWSGKNVTSCSLFSSFKENFCCLECHLQICWQSVHEMNTTGHGACSFIAHHDVYIEAICLVEYMVCARNYLLFIYIQIFKWHRQTDRHICISNCLIYQYTREQSIT